MKVLAKEIAAALAFVAIGVAVSLGVAVPQRVGASPDPGVSYVWRGMMPWTGWHCYDGWSQFAGWHPCWHSNEVGGDYKAIDYNRWDQTAGSTVYLDYSGDGQLFKIMRASGLCKGVRAELYWGSYDPANYKGDIHYLHIDPNEYWFDKEVPYLQVIWIGNVASDENPNCKAAGYWDAAHLHQSADVSPATPFYTNKLVDPSQDDEWQHAIMWDAGDADADGDQWISQNELYIGTDPFDDCPDNSSDNAWPPDIYIDTKVNIFDVMEYYAAGALPSEVGDLQYDNRLDLTADGSIDLFDMMTLVAYLGTQCS
jgi:hypothetical protein